MATLIRLLPFLLFCLVVVIAVSPLLALVLFLTRTRGMNWKAKLILIATWILELPGIGARFILAIVLAPLILMPVWVLFSFIDAFFVVVVWLSSKAGETIQHIVTTNLAGIGMVFIGIGLFLYVAVVIGISWGPLIGSFLSLIGLRGGADWFTSWSMNSRRGSDREKESYTNTLALIQTHSPQPMKASPTLRVLRKLTPEVYTVGSTIYISAPLLKPENGKDLLALMAHHLGHTNSIDGRLVLALRRLIVPPIYILAYGVDMVAPGLMTVARAAGATGYSANVVVWVINVMLSFAGGGLGLLLLSPLWIWYFKEVREPAADAFAASLGFKHQLIDHLEHNMEYFDWAVPYMMNPFSDNELRIDRLLKAQSARRTTQPLAQQTQR
jgi:hypothetical protein